MEKTMQVDFLVAEIGSTTTYVNAINLTRQPYGFIGRGYAKTTVETDVTEGLKEAINDLRKQLNVAEISYQKLFATSSAAGGLKMTVHGLVYDMTAKAAKEAALNAGANVHFVTANLLTEDDLEMIHSIKPNIIVVAGGTDYGEKEVAFKNLNMLKDLNIPLIYSGNIENHIRIKKLNIPHLTIVENVYPRVDDFNIFPLRKAIYDVFEKHIIHAKGMHSIFEMVNGNVIPTPGAVMETTLLLNEINPNVMTIDVGGATTDVHSISEPQPQYQKYLEGEPISKRTVEGDLGVYVNRESALIQMSKYGYQKNVPLSEAESKALLETEPFIPTTEKGKELIQQLAVSCAKIAVDRHAGDLRRIYTTSGMKVIPEGKDLSLVQTVYLTGGALNNNPMIKEALKMHFKNTTTKLLPRPNVNIVFDKDYLFASLGVLSIEYKEEVKTFLNQYLKEV
ncbi:MAG: glutamate mutase L [Acholeplasmataceae bacterium]|nr:glutamate mutase L [Acholeplasmataceae bacterium]